MRSRTVAGLPTTAYMPSSTSLQEVRAVTNLRLGPATRMSDSTDVWPGGCMNSRGMRSPFFARYQKWGSNSARACSSVSATYTRTGQPSCSRGTS